MATENSSPPPSFNPFAPEFVAAASVMENPVCTQNGDLSDLKKMFSSMQTQIDMLTTKLIDLSAEKEKNSGQNSGRNFSQSGKNYNSSRGNFNSFSPVVCYHCGISGHTKRTCRQLIYANRGRENFNARSNTNLNRQNGGNFRNQNNNSQNSTNSQNRPSNSTNNSRERDNTNVNSSGNMRNSENHLN